MNHKDKQHNAGFTLVELIVVIVIIAIIAGFAAMSYAKIAKGMRMSSAKNTVIASLDNARALAIRENRYVITVFRPRLIKDGSEQVIDLVIANWFGDSSNADWGGGTIRTYDRFVPVPSVEIRTLPSGIGIAGPAYGVGDDDLWWVPTYLPAVAFIADNEPKGEVVGILYNPEGRVVVRNSESGSDRIWVDFDSDGIQTIDPDPDRNPNTNDEIVINWASGVMPQLSSGSNFDLEGPGGESNIGMTLIVTVFDENECRAAYSPSTWNDDYDRYRDYTTFINQTSDRIQFNRYSGVPLE
ncbi:MAG: prepilin-type N-terminal cleavage/methylation domain-containing protein [Phycisphaerales bacterium]|nr:prepilin-type N-terminal cleavage/methylation domain-containing protein [Phycisphaerales bacterium]